MAALDRMPMNMTVAYREAVAGFLHALEVTEKAGQLNDETVFAPVLTESLSLFGLTASELAEAENISKAAISKWINGHAIPPPPTRKTVFNWIKKKGKERLTELSNHTKRAANAGSSVETAASARGKPRGAAKFTVLRP
jgi:hypothetical protein